MCTIKIRKLTSSYSSCCFIVSARSSSFTRPRPSAGIGFDPTTDYNPFGLLYFGILSKIFVRAIGSRAFPKCPREEILISLLKRLQPVRIYSALASQHSQSPVI